MKTRYRILSLLLLLCLTLAPFSFTACGPDGELPEEPSHTDYAASVKLDMNSSTKKTEATVKSFIDGDTTHFLVEESGFEGGVLKARYLAVNTPESTGKIEEWGKAASNYTKEKLSAATSVILESDTEKWNVDSTGGRYLVWVWYKTADSEEYRNLNIEILQNGLAIASNSANNRYGDTCMAAINQAKTEKLHVHSGQKDPNFPYGSAAELTLKELRTNITEYDNQKVAFEGVVVKNNSNTVYVEEYDPESGLYYGMQVYYGYSLPGTGLEILSVGNRVRIVGTVQYYETGATYQVSGLEYSPMRPNDPNNIQKLSEGHAPAFTSLDAKEFADGKVTLTLGDENREFRYAELILYTSVELRVLTVKRVSTTESESSKGAMTLTCQTPDGTEIKIRTIVLRDDNGQLITAETFEGKTIDVKGLVDYYKSEYQEHGEYQVKIFSIKDVIFHQD